MIRGMISKAALLGAAALLCTAPTHAETLRDAIAAAYATNPTLAEAQARQEALEEAPEQARAEARPTLSAIANGGYDDLGYGGAGSADLQAAMPIWTGGRVSAAVRASSADVAAGEQVVRDSEAAVLQSVIAAYADLLFAQEAVEVARIGIERLVAAVIEAHHDEFGIVWPWSIAPFHIVITPISLSGTTINPVIPTMNATTPAITAM